MKKILAITLALSMVLALASCGGDDTATSSAATSSAAPTSSAATVSTPAISTPTVSVAPTEPVDENLALTGTPFDDGSDEYYDGTAEPKNIIDGNQTAGWQYKSGNTDEDPSLTSETPNVYANDDGTLFVAMTFEDGIHIGLTWEEAVTVDEFKFIWEFGSRPECSEEGYIVEVSEDGENWEKLEDAEVTYAEEKPAEGTPDEPDVFTFEAMEIKGVRAVVYRSSTKYSPKLWELEVYGPAEDAEADGEADAETDTDADADAETDAE